MELSGHVLQSDGDILEVELETLRKMLWGKEEIEKADHHIPEVGC